MSPTAKNLFCKKGSWISKKLLLHRLLSQPVYFFIKIYTKRVGANCVRPCHIAEIRRANAVRPYKYLRNQKRLRQQARILKIFGILKPFL